MNFDGIVFEDMLYKRKLDHNLWQLVLIVLKLSSKFVCECAFYCVKYHEPHYLNMLHESYNFNVNIRNKYSDTLLICAAKYNSYACAQWLLHKGARVSASDFFGRYPLFFARSYDMEFLLLWYGSKFYPRCPWYYEKIYKLHNMKVPFDKAKLWIRKCRHKWTQ